MPLNRKVFLRPRLDKKPVTKTPLPPSRFWGINYVFQRVTLQIHCFEIFICNNARPDGILEDLGGMWEPCACVPKEGPSLHWFGGKGLQVNTCHELRLHSGTLCNSGRYLEKF